MPSASPSADRERKGPEEFLPALAIETSRQPGSVALAPTGGGIHHLELPDRGDLAAQLLPAMDELCRRTETDRRSLALVVVGIGPGSFTGLRAGVAVAATIAAWQQVPLVALPSFAGSSITTRPGLTAVCLDALRGEVQGAIYLDGRELLPPTLTDGADFVARLEEFRRERAEDGLIGGNGVVNLAAAGGLPEGWTEYREKVWEPRADLLLERGMEKAGQSEWTEPERVEPLYLRPSAAEERRDAT